MTTPVADTPHCEPSSQPVVTTWDLVLACLSVYVIAALVIDLLMDLPAEIAQIIHIMDTSLCMVFLADVMRRFYQAPDKLAFWKWGWIDLLASIPSIDALRWGRVVSVARLFIILRAVRSGRVLLRVLKRDPARAVVALTLLCTTFVMIGCSMMVLVVETAEKSNIKTGYDALWWSLTTVTTVGYGDHFPVTPQGRIFGGVLMIIGITLYATLTAFVSAKIMELKQRTRAEEPDTTQLELRQLRAQVDELKALLTAMVPAAKESPESEASKNS
jgi:voltage-gated potassium channel